MNSKNFRLPTGGLIDRKTPVRFTFDGERHWGFAGDSLASALLANGVRIVGRSFKFHRPRGVYAAGADEPNALVQLETLATTIPNVQATQIELYDALVARSQNNWPSLRFDFLSMVSWFDRFLPAGFYYKTFMWPKSFWVNYEYLIRKAAGLGCCPEFPDPDCYDKNHVHCDVIVIGGGVAGITAALSAGRAGARVILVDDNSRFGGKLLIEDRVVDGKSGTDWISSTVNELETMDNVRLLIRSTAFGYYDHNFLAVNERLTDHLPLGTRTSGIPRQRLWKVRAKQVVLATGAIERPLIFSNNDRPGVMLSSAALTFVNRYGVAPGRKCIVFTNNDEAYRAALALHKNGVEIAAIVDLRKQADGTLPLRAQAAGLRIIWNSAITEVVGHMKVRAARVMALSANASSAVGIAEIIPCDLICSSGGWNPAVHLFSQSGGKLRFDETLAAFVPERSTQELRSAGACNGSSSLTACVEQGFEAGIAAARDAGFTRDVAMHAPQVENERVAPLRSIWVVPSDDANSGGRQHFVDIQNDVTVADIRLSIQEGYSSAEHLKRYTTTGMGPDQGKTSNINAIAILAENLGVDIATAGTTTFRPPYTPVTFGAIAGRHVGPFFKPVRRTPLHSWHESNNATLENSGLWMRALAYPQPGETVERAAVREARATRASVGLTDVSSLGKIDIQGPDALNLLTRLYANDLTNLKVGRCRYGLMLRETGKIFDDGIAARLDDNHYLLSTTTANGEHVFDWIEEWLQCFWPNLQVYVTCVTEHWAQMALAGPNSRKVLSKLVDGMNLTNESFPFFTIKQGKIATYPARIFRVSFSGELGYEIAVPARYGIAVWRELLTAGHEFDITSYGLEALMLLRAEKGFILVGEDTDGTQSPQDMGMGWMLSNNKNEFIGKRSLTLKDHVRTGRQQFVGLKTIIPDQVLDIGTPVVEMFSTNSPMTLIGHVTASYFSPALGRSITLALTKDGQSRIGETVCLVAQGRAVEAQIVSPRFFDPEGHRVNS